MGWNEFREWINTIVAILALVLLFYGTIWGVSELRDVNVNLENVSVNLQEITSDTVTTKKVEVLRPNGSVGTFIHCTDDSCIFGSS